MAFAGRNEQALHSAREHPSPWMIVWVALRSHKGALVGAGVFVFFVLAVIIGPLINPIDPHAQDILNRNAGPSLGHLMGTDNIGRDMFALMLSGGRIAIAVGFTAMVLSLVVGTAIGVLADAQM